MNRDRNFRGNRNQQSNYGQMYSGGSGSNSMFSDFGPMNNRGSRSGNRPQTLLDLRTGMSRMDDDEDFTVDSYTPSKNYGSKGMGGKTPEQIAFDNEFEKWEQSFADWKLNNRNHPNPDQYRMYEQKFLDVRSKLLKKRRELYGESSISGSGKNPFDNQLNAADAMANSILSKFGSPSGNSGRKNNNSNNNQGGNDRRGGGGGGNNNRGNNYSGNDNNNGRNNNYGGNSSNSGRNNNNGGGNSSNSGRNNNNDGGNSGRNNNNGGSGNNDILNNELILTALKVITGGMGNMGGPMGGMGGPMGGMGGPMGGMGGPMGNMRNNMGPMGNMRGPMDNMGGPMYNRGGYGGNYGGGYNDGPYGSGYGRNYGRGYGDGYGRGYNNGPNRRPGGDSRLGPQRVGVNKNNSANKNDKKKRTKKPAGEKKVLKEGEFDSSTPFLDRVPQMYEEARKTDLPKLLSGAGNRRYKILKDKAADTLSEKEKQFMEYATYVFKKREEYYIAHPKEAKDAKIEDATMAEEKTAEAKAADANISEDVEMNEDELLKD